MPQADISTVPGSGRNKELLQTMGRGRSGPNYIAHVVPGLEAIALEEMRTTLERAEARETLRHFDERTSLVLFTTTARVRDLLALRTVEDIFVLALDERNVPPAWRGLHAIRGAVSQAGTRIEAALTIVQEARPHRKGRTGFRVVARKAGEHAYRRVDVQHAIEQGITQRFPAWRRVVEGGVELWASLVESHLLIGVRLSDNTMRQRTWRKASLPAALKPTVAAAMVLLSAPRDDDIFLDPMCGSGTILIERALAGRYRQLLGGDSDAEAVKATLENIGPRYKPIHVQEWDARSLPLDTASVSAIACNLPFGKQIGSPAKIRSLYPALLAEWERVLAPGGRMVLLTSERNLLRRSLEKRSALAVTREVQVLVRGQRATIVLVRCG